MSQGTAIEIENATLRERVDALQQENHLLRQKIDALIRRYYGKSSEAIDPAQLELIVAGLMAAAQPPRATEQNVAPVRTARPSPKPVRRLSLPADVPVERVVIEPAEVQQQPELWKQIGEEVTEEWDYTPGQFLKRLFIRPKYVRRETSVTAVAAPAADPAGEPAAVVIAPLPPRLIEKGLPGPGLLTQVLIRRRTGVNSSHLTVLGKPVLWKPMARPIRVEFEGGAVYHVTVGGNERWSGRAERGATTATT